MVGSSHPHSLKPANPSGGRFSAMALTHQPTFRGSVPSWFSSHLREKYQPFQIPGDPKVTDSGPWDFLSHLQI